MSLSGFALAALWCQPSEVAREQRRLADVRRLDQPRHPALQPDREAAVRRHAVLERLQVALERRRAHAALAQRRQVVGVAVQPLPARDQLQPAEQQVEAARVPRPRRVGVRVEGALGGGVFSPHTLRG